MLLLIGLFFSLNMNRCGTLSFERIFYVKPWHAWR